MNRISKIALVLFVSIGLVACSVKPTEQAKAQNEETKEVYLNHLSNQTASWSVTFSNFADLMSYPNVGNKSWSDDLVLQLLIMQDLVDNARTMVPPKEFKASHKAYLKAMDYYEVIPTTLPKAIDEGDSAAIDRVIVAMEKGNQELQNSASLLNP